MAKNHIWDRFVVTALKCYCNLFQICRSFDDDGRKVTFLLNGRFEDNRDGQVIPICFFDRKKWEKCVNTKQ